MLRFCVEECQRQQVKRGSLRRRLQRSQLDHRVTACTPGQVIDMRCIAEMQVAVVNKVAQSLLTQKPIDQQASDELGSKGTEKVL